MLLYEVLFKEESEDYFKAQTYLRPLVSYARRALKAISGCDIEELQTVLDVVEKKHSNKKYDKDYEDIQVELQRVLNFLESFKRRFSEAVDKSILNTPKQMASAIAGNIINLITQDDQLGFEESVVILHSLRPIVDRLASESESENENENERLMNNIYITGLNICERYNIYDMNFAITISSNDNWSIDQFIRGCNPRLDNIVKNGISSILGSKKEIKKLDGKLKKDLKLAYKALVEKKYRFSLAERYRALFL